MAAILAKPVMIDSPVAMIIGSVGSNRCACVAARTAPAARIIVVLRWRMGPQRAGLPLPLEPFALQFTVSFERVLDGVGHGSLPSLQAGAQPVSQASVPGAEIVTDDEPICVLFDVLASALFF